MTIYKSTIQLLRIPFSINLLPIFLFAIYTADQISWWKLALIFIVIHFIFYPASNAYNSFMDRDTGAIAGIEKPPKPTQQLYYASIVLDLLGLLISAFISMPFLVINLLLVLLSRAYSWRGIRIKKYALAGFVMVALAQGGASFLNMYMGMNEVGIDAISSGVWRNTIVASLFVAAIYPITQIYQHEEDESNGDMTISRLLGIRGTFLFSGFIFILANVLLYFSLELRPFIIFELVMLLPMVYFIYWMLITWDDFTKANFKRTMTMALSAAMAMNIGFLAIIILKAYL